MKHKKRYFYQVADAAGISPTTARKYLKATRLPSELKKQHDWKMRDDIFADIQWLGEMALKPSSHILIPVKFR